MSLPASYVQAQHDESAPHPLVDEFTASQCIDAGSLSA